MSFVNWTQLLFILVSEIFFLSSNFESSSSAFLLLFMQFLQINPMVKTHLPRVCGLLRQRLTLHAQPIRAVLGLQDKAIAVLASILGGGCRALPPAPVSALGPAGRPLGSTRSTCHPLPQKTKPATGQREKELLEGRESRLK